MNELNRGMPNLNPADKDFWAGRPEDPEEAAYFDRIQSAVYKLEELQRRVPDSASAIGTFLQTAMGITQRNINWIMAEPDERVRILEDEVKKYEGSN